MGVEVSFEDLVKRFPGQKDPALRGLTARIRSGIITGLVGPDGAGKTTVMRLIAGLLEPTSGTLVAAEADTQGETGANRDVSRRAGKEVIGYMPQKFGLYEELSVQENLNLYADLRGVLGEERQAMFEKLLRFTALGRFTDRLAGHLSGGMKQKLGLACALLGRPRLLLLDEPSVGVDPISRRELWHIVSELLGEGLTVVWSTAYLDEAELCDEVLLLNQGQLLFAGEPAALTSRVRNRCFQLRNIGGSRREVLARALKNPAVSDGTIQGQNVRVVLRQGGDTAVLREAAGNSQAELAAVPPRFEDAFIDILGGGPGGESALAAHVENRERDDATVVEAVNLTKKFGKFVAADNISFLATRGEVFGLLGPNGAGKSTTFRMLCGLLMPTAGTAHVMGIDLRKSPSRARQRLGYMAQKFSLYGNLTVRQNLNFFSRAYGLHGSQQREAVEHMLGIFHLSPLTEHPAETLPLGYKQRLALAVAMIHSPDIVFLDEPTSGVDPVSRREFWNHINGIVEKGVTVVVTTHFMEEAEYCDRIALVSQGRIIAAGIPDALKAQAVTAENPDPSMEDAFIHLVRGAQENPQ